MKDITDAGLRDILSFRITDEKLIDLSYVQNN